MQAQSSISIITFIKYRVKQGLMIDRVIGAQREACLGGNGLDHKDVAEGACNDPSRSQYGKSKRALISLSRSFPFLSLDFLRIAVNKY